ncbi:MAG: hypothetical protein K1X39_03920 [Thermoflexales bacterium]|nr:hypothetical protein [Thermoflexales bacterium]
MPRRRNTPSPSRVGGLICLAVGAVLLLAGLAVAAFFPPLLAKDAARLAAVPALTGRQLADTPAGRDALVEGVISSDQPLLFRDFVAYQREEREYTDDNRKPWQPRERRLPPLTLLTADGAITFVNADYPLGNEAAAWSAPADPLARIEVRYTGFRRGDAVVAIGRSEAGGLRVSALSAGTRAALLQAQAEASDVARALGLGLSAAGAVTALVGALLLRPPMRAA